MPRLPILRRAFTIIELMVVLALVSALATILLPILGRVREVANMTQCSNNLHNNGVAIRLYGYNNKEAYPDFFYNWDPGQNQANTVVVQFVPKKAATTGWTYLDPNCMVCPNDEDGGAVHVKDPVTGDVTDYPCSYDVNVDFLIRDHTQDGTTTPSALALMFDGDIGEGIKQGAYLGTDSWATTAFKPRHIRNRFGSVLWADGHVTQELTVPLTSWVMQGDDPWVHGHAGDNK